MRRGSEQSAETRERLLEAGAEVFSAKGFRGATVREIVTRAGAANLSAVNYHFGDKAQLYGAVLERLMKQAHEKYPTRMGLKTGAPPKERLFGFVRAFLHRIFDPGIQSRMGRLMALEMVDPTPALDRVVEAVIRPLFGELCLLVRELLPRKAGYPEVDTAAKSIVGQILFYKHSAAVLERLDGRKGMNAGAIEALARHLTAFSLGGLRALRPKKRGRS